MDIRVKAMLDYVQSVAGFENSVIAGGAVRDFKYDMEPKDYDIFVPIQGSRSLGTILDAVIDHFKVDKVLDKGTDYDGAQRINGVTEITYEGKVFDFIGKKAPNDKDFGFAVIKEFDFGNSMAFYNGLYIEDTNEYWKTDMDYHSMSLINMESMQHLPNHIERFNRFKNKVKEHKNWNVVFKAPCLKMVKEPPVKEKYYAKKAAGPVGGRWEPEPPMEAGRAVVPVPRNRMGEIPMLPAFNEMPRAVPAPARDILNPLINALDNPWAREDGRPRDAQGRFQRAGAGLPVAELGAGPIGGGPLVGGVERALADGRVVREMDNERRQLVVRGRVGFQEVRRVIPENVLVDDPNLERIIVRQVEDEMNRIRNRQAVRAADNFDQVLREIDRDNDFPR